MDLLQFDACDLYFDTEDSEDVQKLIRSSSRLYSSGAGELPLLQAYLRAPESLNVLVALNRYYYYQHRLADALLIAEKALAVIRRDLDFPEDWRQLEMKHISEAPKSLLARIRFYLFTLKSIGFLHLRMHHPALSHAIFEKLVALDDRDRIGAKALLELAGRQQETAMPE